MNVEISHASDVDLSITSDRSSNRRSKRECTSIVPNMSSLDQGEPRIRGNFFKHVAQQDLGRVYFSISAEGLQVDAVSQSKEPVFARM